jgi:cobalt-zinc-cadmium efflux system outer membrane protein
MMQKELSADAAVQIALIGNPGLQATYEELGVAQADLVQAGLLPNPTIGVGFLFPVKGDALTEREFSLTEDFLAIFMIPAKKRIARAQLEAAKLRVADAIVRVAFDVRADYFRLQGALQELAMRQIVLEAGEASIELARRQAEAGNISDLDLANEEAVYEQLRLDVAQSKADVIVAREQLVRAMGLFGNDADPKLSARLPELPSTDPPLEHLESTAVARRFDLAAARFDVRSLSETIAMVKNFRWLGGLSAGVTVVRAFEGPTLVGPGISAELPLFDQKQALIARLESLRRQAIARETALALDIRSEVRVARNKLLLARGLVERYATLVVPLRQKVVTLSQQQYDAMLIGVFQLLVAKQNEVNAYRTLIAGVRDYWIARAELERAVGGTLVASKTSASKKP